MRTCAADFPLAPDASWPRSSRSTLRMPIAARWKAVLVPLTPPPTTTTSALVIPVSSRRLPTFFDACACLLAEQHPDGRRVLDAVYVVSKRDELVRRVSAPVRRADRTAGTRDPQLGCEPDPLPPGG